jgi:hypothetical protein
MNWLHIALVFVVGFGAGFLVLVGSSSRLIGNAYTMGFNDGFRKAIREEFHAVREAKENVFGRLPN